MAVLTEEERREYEPRASPAAGRTRSRLGAFDATEEEFLAALALQQQLPLEGEASRAELDRQFAEQFEAILGEERFEEFRIKSDPAWHEVDALVTRLDLPPAVTRNVVSIQRELQQRVKARTKRRSSPPSSVRPRCGPWCRRREPSSVRLSVRRVWKLMRRLLGAG